MARDRDLFGLALGRLREDLRDGRFHPGGPLTTADLAASLNISATPIREAIARLTGEGLVQDLRGRGAYALSYSASEVEELYLLHGAYVGLACDLGRLHHHYLRFEPSAAPTSASPRSLREQTERLWETLVRNTDGGALLRNHQRVTDQLAVLRLVEPIVLTDLGEELAELSRRALQSDADALSAGISAYHERRREFSRDISALVRDHAGSA